MQFHGNWDLLHKNIQLINCIQQTMDPTLTIQSTLTKAPWVNINIIIINKILASYWTQFSGKVK